MAYKSNAAVRAVRAVTSVRAALVTIAWLALALSAEARGYYWNYVHRGNVSALTNVTGASAKFQGSYPGASVLVKLCGTSTNATLYSNSTGTSTANPITASGTGYYDFWTDATCVSLTFSGGGIVGSFTIPTTYVPSAGTGGNIAGAVCNGTVDDTAAFAAAAAITGAHRNVVPAGVCLVTSEVLIDQDRVSWVGQGKQTSVINFVPTADDKAAFHYDLAAATPIYQGAVRDLTIKSTDTTYRKFAIRCTDCSEFDVENVAVYPFEGGPDISPFTGGSSSGLYLEGREIGSFRNIEISADIPIRIGDNPNATIDIDHHHFENIYLLAQGSTPNIWIESGVSLTNVTFDGYQSWVGGKYGLYWVDTTSTIPSTGLSIANLRYEQPAARGWIVDIEQNQTLYGFTLSNSYGGSLVTIDGVKLRKVRRTRLDSYSYNGTGVALDVDSTVTEGLEGRNVFAQTGSTVSITGLTRVWAVGPPLGAGYPLWSTWRYEPTAQSNFSAGYCFELMGLNKCAGSGTVADTATVTLPSLGGAAALLGRVTVVVEGATKHASCTVSYDSSSSNVESTTNAVDCTKGNTAGAFCVHYSNPASIVLRNNLGESVKYWYEVTQIP